MRLVLSSFFLFFYILCKPVVGENIQKTYIVKTSGLKIGVLDWSITTNKNTYSNHLRLKSEGLLSTLYNFKGEYYSEGFFKENNLKPVHYKHLWQTKKITKNMDLKFYDGQLSSLIQTPIEKEKLRIDVFNIGNISDPLTSFLQIIMGQEESLVVDGRRIYKMSSTTNEGNNQKTIEIKNYSNLWADHKRNKFEKIIFEKDVLGFFPIKIFIFFDDRVFILEQN